MTSAPPQITHALVDWVDEELSSVIPMANILSPKKMYSAYEANDLVAAKCPGFVGRFDAIIIDTSGK